MKKALSILLAMTALLSLAACQATPVEPIVVKKDTDRLVEHAMPAEGEIVSIEELVPKDYYTFDTTGANGKLTIHVAANITKPGSTVMPITEVSMGLFTQKQVTGLFNYLFPDEKPIYDFGQVETKSDLEQELLRLKQQLASSNDKGLEDRLKASIAQVEAAYQSAPEIAPEGGVSDGTLTRTGAGPNDMSRLLQVSSRDYTLSVITLTNLEGISGMQLPHLRFRCKDAARIYSTRNMVRVNEGVLPEKAKKDLAISLDDAQSLCDGFFVAAGFANDDFCVADAFIIDDTDADEQPGENYAYRFLYRREVDGCPVFFDKTGLLDSKDDAFSIPWGYEYIEFIIDNDGIVSIEWFSPIAVGTTIQSETKLKSYNEIMAVFETMMKTSYEGILLTAFDGAVTFDISIDNIELCLIRIRRQGGSQTDGLLVPAWVFSGRNKATEKNGEVKYLQGSTLLSNYDYTGVAAESGAVSKLMMLPGVREGDTVILMAINAIDGSIIDLQKGY